MGKAHGPKTARDLAPDSLHLRVTDLISLEYLKMMSVHFQLCYPHQRSLVEVGAEYQVPYWNNASVTYG